MIPQVRPQTYLMGVTQPDEQEVIRYLKDTDQQDFWESWVAARTDAGPLCLVSMFAKMCYKSLVEGKNANVERIRDIPDNIKGVINQQHGAVFEHVELNFITRNCSRVFTHELVRHRAGTAFSQTSGRYVALDEVKMVLPDELAESVDCWQCHGSGELTDKQCNICKGFGSTRHAQERMHQMMSEALPALRNMLIREGDPMAKKKRLTSAIRRWAPNGQENEIAWSVNVRSLRHIIELRTSRHAEWEIRLVFNQVAQLVLERWPLMLYGAWLEDFDGLIEYTKLRI